LRWRNHGPGLNAAAHARYGERSRAYAKQIEALCCRRRKRDYTQGPAATPYGRRRPQRASDCRVIDLAAKAQRTASLRAARSDKASPVPNHLNPDSVSMSPLRWGQAARKCRGERFFLIKTEDRGAGDLARVEAVRDARTPARRIVDDNEEDERVDDLTTLTPKRRKLGLP